MKCPICGAPMKDGTLYCEHCGEEIRIVPEFEPELDKTYRQTIEDMTSGLWKEDGRQGKQGEAPKQEPEPKRKPKREKVPAAGQEHPGKSFTQRLIARLPSPMLWIVICLILLMGLVAGGLGYLRYINLDSTKCSRAEKAVENGDYDYAITVYRGLLAGDHQNPEYLEKLAEAYRLSGNEILYENTLWELTQSPERTQEQYRRAYEELIGIYAGLEDYASLTDLLSGCEDAELVAKYAAYLPPKISFSIPGGYYDSPQLLKLEATQQGAIYYTLDGKDPAEGGMLYEYPLLLDDGDTVVSACCIGENGIRSDTLTETYHVSAAQVPPPELSTASGSYQKPVLLTLKELPDGVSVRYTLDGTVPDEGSELFPDAMPLPEGKTELTLVSMDGTGRMSEPVTFTYTVTLNAPISTEQGRAYIYLYTGEFQENCDYRYVYPLELEQGLYYVFYEMRPGRDGIWKDTGLMYAVDYRDGTTGRLYTEDGGYRLEIFESIA